MPANVRPVADERDALLAYLDQERYALRLASFGLSDEEARATPTPSQLSIGGTIKHLAAVERFWIDEVVLRKVRLSAGGEQSYADGFRLGQSESLEQVLGLYAEAAANTTAAIAAVSDLDRSVPVPKDVPWFPKDVEAWSVRWVVFHLLQETARHAGHLDIIREAIDGATAVPLIAAAEGWPPSPWVKPWTR